jgi:hypothetical protein
MYLSAPSHATATGRACAVTMSWCVVPVFLARTMKSSSEFEATGNYMDEHDLRDKYKGRQAVQC